MRIVFMGTGEIGVPSLKALADSSKYVILGVITQPDRPIGRHQVLHASPIKAEAVARNIPVFQPEKINTSESLEILKNLNPDLVIVCAYGQILKKDLLGIPPKGFINIHASLLPRYRGAACIPAAIRNGDPKSGITIIQVDEGLDTGDILFQAETDIRDDDTSGTLHDRLADLAAPTLLKALDLMDSGEMSCQKQDSSQSSYAPKLKKEDGIIHWNKTAIEIERHIRAMIPWPTAYTWLPDERKMLKIFSVEIEASSSSSAKHGEIIHLSRDKIGIATGEGKVLLNEVQLEGKKRMKVEEFLKGHHLKLGQVLISD